jgi:hypothetical protein
MVFGNSGEYTGNLTFFTAITKLCNRCAIPWDPGDERAEESTSCSGKKREEAMLGSGRPSCRKISNKEIGRQMAKGVEKKPSSVVDARCSEQVWTGRRLASHSMVWYQIGASQGKLYARSMQELLHFL